jgi:hypothetical protein
MAMHQKTIILAKKFPFKMVFIAFSLLIILSCSNALADVGHIGIGTGVLYTNTKTNYVNEFEEITSPKLMLNLSYVKSFDKFVLNTSTNRIGNNARIRTILNNKKEFQVKSTSNIDTLALGYQIGKITPYLLVGNVDTKQEIRYKGRTIQKDNETALIWGTALSYRFYNQTISINLIAPSKPLNLRYAVGFGYNFYI